MPAARGEALAPVAVEGLSLRHSTPLEFSRAWLLKMDAVRRQRADLHARGQLAGVSPAELARVGAALTGELRVPVIAVRYADVNPPFPVVELANRLFGPSQGDTLSYADYWREVSGGLLQVDGIVTSWVTLRHSARHYLPAGDYGWGRFGRVAEFRQQVLDMVDPSIDFSAFDNDGPDGVPNSGDDDGYADFVAFFYATGCGAGAPAGGIWPHRGAMTPYQTDDAAAGGGRIRVTDYVILPAQGADTCAPAHVGVLAHETAHAFGMPDLYDYDGSSRGIGSWGLMGTGSHASPHSPAHPSAWVKEQLGWVRMDWLNPGREVDLKPVQSHARVLRYDLDDGSGRYLLLEHRAEIGSDRDLPGHGLLVWGVNLERGELGLWNSDERSPAVALLAPDETGALVDARGGDRAGPFPGRGDSLGGERLPVRVEATTDAAGLRVRLDASPGLGWERGDLKLASIVGGDPVSRRVRVADPAGDRPWGARVGAEWLRVRRAGDSIELEADPSGLRPGSYEDSVELVDGPSGQVLDRLAVRLDVVGAGAVGLVAGDLPWSWGIAATDSGLVHAGTGWDAIGLRPRPRLLRVPPDGALPRTMARIPVEALYAPTAGPDGAVHVLGRASGRNYIYRVDPGGDVAVVAADVLDEPAYGLATLPDGSLLVAGWSGRIVRVTRDGATEPWAELQRPVYQIAADASGVVYAALLSGHVMRVEPQGSIRLLATGFDRGRLVSVAVAPDGRAFAAERGQQGRLIELTAVGPRLVARVPDGEFYGLAADALFLYALDLSNRELVRVPIAGPGARFLAAGEDRDS